MIFFYKSSMSFLLGASSCFSFIKLHSFSKVFSYTSNLSIYYSFVGLKIFFIYSISVFKLFNKKAELSLLGVIKCGLGVSFTSVGPSVLYLSYNLSLNSFNSNNVWSTLGKYTLIFEFILCATASTNLPTIST